MNRRVVRFSQPWPWFVYDLRHVDEHDPLSLLVLLGALAVAPAAARPSR